MIKPKNNPTKIRAIMKISAQIIGPSDEQSKLEMDLSDYKNAKGQLMLPPQLNPEVYQYSIKIFRGKSMDINMSFWGFTDVIDPFIKVTLGDHCLQTDVKNNDTNPTFNETLFIPMTIPSMTQ